MDIEYHIMKSNITIEGCLFNTYGITAVEKSSAKIKSAITDVSLDKMFVLNIVEILNSAEVELCQFGDVVTDELNK